MDGAVDVELLALHSFIEEQRQWLDSVLHTLGWSRESLEQGQPRLMQCPYNNHHFIAKSSLEQHKLKCRYGAVDKACPDEVESEMATSASTTFVGISSSIVQAIKKYAETSEKESVQHQVGQQGREKIDQSDVVLESHETSSSLQSQASTPPDILAQDPLHIIRYIKAWPLVPADFVQFSSSSLNPVEVKAWLFNNLPDKHSYSSQLGGEIVAAETVVKALTSQPSLTPDTIVTQLTPLLAHHCRSFVLKLWKFLHTVILQRQHTILDSVVAELAPLPLSAVSFLKCEGASQTLEDSFADKIQEIAAECECPSSPLLPLPMGCVPHLLTPLERKLLYNYVVEVGGAVYGSQSKDPSLFRDDAAAIKAKLKQKAREESEVSAGEGGRGRAREASLHQLKKERDYKRRRQKYRAQNVHITHRTPAQVMRDIINARMLEISNSIASMAEEKDTPSTTDRKDEMRQKQEPPETQSGSAESPSLSQEREERRSRRDSKTSRRHSERERDDRERLKRSRSRERLRRSKSRERLRRSKSRERSKKDSRRSRSRERRKRSRSDSRSREQGRDSHSDSRERDRHKKRSRDRRTSNASEQGAESRSKSHKSRHATRASKAGD